MDEEHTGRRRWKIAGVITAAVLAVPGGAVISNAFAADGGDATSPSTQSSQSVPAQSETPAPQQRGDGDPGGRGDHGDCPGKDGDNGSGSGESGASGTGYTQQ